MTSMQLGALLAGATAAAPKSGTGANAASSLDFDAALAGVLSGALPASVDGQATDAAGSPIPTEQRAEPDGAELTAEPMLASTLPVEFASPPASPLVASTQILAESAPVLAAPGVGTLPAEKDSPEPVSPSPTQIADAPLAAEPASMPSPAPAPAPAPAPVAAMSTAASSTPAPTALVPPAPTARAATASLPSALAPRGAAPVTPSITGDTVIDSGDGSPASPTTAPDAHASAAAATSSGQPMPALVSVSAATSESAAIEAVAASSSTAPSEEASSAATPPVAPQPVAVASPATARVAAPAPAAPVPFAAQVAGPVFTLAAAGPGEHVMTVNVTPDNLGPVIVRAHVNGDGIRVELFAPTDGGRDALRAILSDLRRDLSAAGTNASLDLSAKNQPSRDDGQRRESAGQPPAFTSGSGARDETREHPFRPAAWGATSTIDIFA